MDLLLNDLSVHEQFHDPAEFRDALSRLMALRETARRFGRQIQCDTALLNTCPIPGMTMQKAVGKLEVERRRAVMVWLTKSGPFWENARQHSEDDWLEYGSELITDRAIGEAAFRTAHGSECGLVSLTPSDWCFSPFHIVWDHGAKELNRRSIEVKNWWSAETLEESLQHYALPLRSWDDLHKTSRNRFANLVFTENCFTPLTGIPFSKSAADRFVVLLGILDRFASTHDADGVRNSEGHQIYQDYFTGGRALFSDSSESEKQDFKQGLTFPHPEKPSIPLFCPWHGKVSHMALRLHFSWPVKAGSQIYVVYAGPKITKR